MAQGGEGQGLRGLLQGRWGAAQTRGWQQSRVHHRAPLAATQCGCTGDCAGGHCLETHKATALSSSDFNTIEQCGPTAATTSAAHLNISPAIACSLNRAEPAAARQRHSPGRWATPCWLQQGFGAARCAGAWLWRALAQQQQLRPAGARHIEEASAHTQRGGRLRRREGAGRRLGGEGACRKREVEVARTQGVTGRGHRRGRGGLSSDPGLRNTRMHARTAAAQVSRQKAQ